MTRAVLTLSALLVLLALADQWLAGRAERREAPAGRVGALYTSEEVARLQKQPALRIELSGESHSFGRIEGQWRALSYHQAPADGRAIQALIDGMLEAEGIVHAATVEEAPRFGINTPRTLSVSLQGPRAMQDPGGDVLATLEIGASQAGRGGCFVRKRGTREIWSIASDLRAPLEQRLAPGLPPLLAASVVPESWLEQGELLCITLERGGLQTRLERRERTLDPAAMKPGDLPWRWVLVPADEPAGESADQDEPASEAREVSQDFVGFLQRFPYRAVLDPAQREALVPTPPTARITLEHGGRAPLEFHFGRELEGGNVALWVVNTTTLYRIEARSFALALPDEATLNATSGAANPWSADPSAADAREPR